MTDDDEKREAYRAWLDSVEHDAASLTLADYIKWREYDSNLPWRLGAGGVQEVLDEAIDRIKELEGQ